MNRNVRRDLEIIRVSIAPLKKVLAAINDRQERQIALRLLAYLEREERGHYTLSLFTRPGLCERNTPKELQPAIDDVDRAAKQVCIGSVFTDAKHADLRAYAARHGYETAADLTAAYTAVRTPVPAKKKEKEK